MGFFESVYLDFNPRVYIFGNISLEYLDHLEQEIKMQLLFIAYIGL